MCPPACLSLALLLCSATGRALNALLCRALAPHLRVHAFRLHAGGWRGVPEVQPDIPAYPAGKDLAAHGVRLGALYHTKHPFLHWFLHCSVVQAP